MVAGFAKPAKGAGLKILSRRSSRVRIPYPALNPSWMESSAKHTLSHRLIELPAGRRYSLSERFCLRGLSWQHRPYGPYRRAAGESCPSGRWWEFHWIAAILPPLFNHHSLGHCSRLYRWSIGCSLLILYIFNGDVLQRLADYAILMSI